MIEMQRDGDVFLLTMDRGENRLSPDLLDAADDLLNTVETTEGPRALVTTGAGKFFSNGLDLDWVGEHPDELVPYVQRVQALFVRILSLPCATVAAQNGHTFAAGAMLAICHDVRVMRTDRGYWCLPEVDLGMPFTPGMNALIPAMVPTRAAHQAMVLGRRFSATEAVAAGIVDESVAEDQVVSRAMERAGELATKAGPNIAGIRRHRYAPVIDLLLEG